MSSSLIITEMVISYSANDRALIQDEMGKRNPSL